MRGAVAVRMAVRLRRRRQDAEEQQHPHQDTSTQQRNPLLLAGRRALYIGPGCVRIQSRKRQPPRHSSSPAATSASITRRPLTQVPLEEPRSRRIQQPSSRRSSAWRRETVSSAKTSWQAEERPSSSRPAASRCRRREQALAAAAPRQPAPGRGQVGREAVQLGVAAGAERALDAARERLEVDQARDVPAAQARQRVLAGLLRRAHGPAAKRNAADRSVAGLSHSAERLRNETV